MAALYTTDILRLASSLRADDHLVEPDGTAECRSPICGSRINAEIIIKDGEISQLAIRASACAMGQASAAIVRKNAGHISPAALSVLREQLAQFLKGDGPLPIIWSELSHLAPAKEYPARHAAILLPFDAVLLAASSAIQATAA
jgi:NifU-like protein involved in Fe-S cluster formation